MKPTWMDTGAYPFEPRAFSLPMGRMSYVDEGKGDPLVMVHGNPSWSFEFRDLIKHFSATHRCIAPDHIGFGLSDKPPAWDYLPQHHAENLEALLESLDLQNITLLLGDWGGPIGCSYAIRHPERVKAVVVTNTWLWSVEDDWYYRAFSGFVGGAVGRCMIHRFNVFARVVVWAVYGDKSKLTRQVHRHYLEPLSVPEERKGSWVFPRQIIGASDWLAELWVRRNRLQGKVRLLAWGMRDIAFREKELQRWRKHFPGARVVRYPNAGHFLAEEESEGLIEELEQVFRD